MDKYKYFVEFTKDEMDSLINYIQAKQTSSLSDNNDKERKITASIENKLRKSEENRPLITLEEFLKD